VRCFDKEKVTKIYGVEPNVDQHAKLRERVKEAGLEDLYVIVPVGVEDLGEKWVKRGEVDTIVTIQVCGLSVFESSLIWVNYFESRLVQEDSSCRDMHMRGYEWDRKAIGADAE